MVGNPNRQPAASLAMLWYFFRARYSSEKVACPLFTFLPFSHSFGKQVRCSDRMLQQTDEHENLRTKQHHTGMVLIAGLKVLKGLLLLIVGLGLLKLVHAHHGHRAPHH